MSSFGRSYVHVVRVFSLRVTICELRSNLIINLRAARDALRISAMLRTTIKNHSVFPSKLLHSIITVIVINNFHGANAT